MTVLGILCGCRQSDVSLYSAAVPYDLDPRISCRAACRLQTSKRLITRRTTRTTLISRPTHAASQHCSCSRCCLAPCV